MVIVKHPVFILVALTLMCFSTFAAKPLVFSTREGAIEGSVASIDRDLALRCWGTEL